MTWDLSFAPLLPAWLALTVAGLALFLGFAGLVLRVPGAWLRAPFMAGLAVLLANPVLRQEDRSPIPDVLTVVVDESRSQDISGRMPTTEAILEAVEDRLSTEDSLEMRVVRTGRSSGAAADPGRAGTDGTFLVSALEAATADIPPDRLAGALFITDGQVHDVPTQDRTAGGRTTGFPGPVHTLLAGRPGEKDRKLSILNAPAFGIVGDGVTVELKVEDLGGEGQGSAAVPLTARLDGALLSERVVRAGDVVTIEIPITHPGANVLELQAAPAEEELTLLNNRTALSISGVRDRLRVLLVSGEPHIGQRTWRNLLKSDPAVDLIHFTILRPPDKQDFTRPDELALIEFPTPELFDEKLEEFDLVIFDRFKRRGVLQTAYFANIARYVERGGALFVATGPAFAQATSIFATPLSAVLPAQPTGEVITRGYRPQLTAEGRRHPVTSDLSGSAPAAADDGETPETTEPSWGQWFRLIETNLARGQPVMTGPDDRPLLVLERVGRGRVAMLLSDHTWLWSRGYEGGGPQQEMLRRVTHWLMKEPELEEEVLSATSLGRTLDIRRRTMGEEVPPVTVTTPSGKSITLALEALEPGQWRRSLETDELGLYRLESGELTAVVAVGALNSREFADVRASKAPTAPLAALSGGGQFWAVAEGSNAAGGEAGPAPVQLPAFRRVRPGRTLSGDNWAGLVMNGRYEVRSSRERPLIPPLLLAGLLVGLLLFAWRWEAR